MAINENSYEGEPPVFGWLGRTVVRHPWWTIMAWVIAAAAAIALAPKLDTHFDQQDFLPSKYESVQAGKLADRAFPSGSQKVSNELMVVKRSDGQALSTGDQQKIGQIAKTLQAKHITGVTALWTRSWRRRTRPRSRSCASKPPRSSRAPA